MSIIVTRFNQICYIQSADSLQSTLPINMPKQYSCSVPSCQTRGRRSSFLNFPANPTMCRQWIETIPNLDCVVDHKSLICTHHFRRSQLVHEENKITTVVTGAVPTIFAQHSAENCTKKYFPKYMFEMIERDVGPETFGDLENLETKDFIVDFYYLKNMHKEELGSFMTHWHVSFTETYAFFYLLSLDHVAKIKCSIKINDKLIVQIALSGRVMDPLDLTWILPATSKITRWSQLKMLLYEFGLPTDKSIDEISPDLLLTPYLKYIN